MPITSTQKKTLSVPYSPGTPQKKYPGHHPKDYPGRNINTLAFGFPQFIHNFCTHILHREKESKPFGISFNEQLLPEQEKLRLKKFQKFYENNSNTLRQIQKEKLLEINKRLAEEQQISKASDNLSHADECHKKRVQLSALFKKYLDPRISRTDLNETDWKVLDAIDFEVLTDHCNSLSPLFQTGWFKQIAAFHPLQTEFGIDFTESLIAETISSVPYIEKLEGKTLNLPFYDPSLKAYRNVVYTIESVTIGDKLPCYLLKSSEEESPSWFAVRGTQRYTKIGSQGEELRIGSSESMLADTLDDECIAKNVINKAIAKRAIVKHEGSLKQKESLEDIFRNLRNVYACGHSLGGTIANTLAVEYPDKIKKTFAFSAVGVSKETYNKWKAKEHSSMGKIINFDYEGDLIPSGGCRMIGEHYALKSINSRDGNGLYKSHVRKHLCYDCEVHKVDIEKENNKLERRITEFFRTIIGKVVEFLLKFSRKERLPDWWRNRKIYQQQADIIRRTRSLEDVVS